MSVIPVSSVGVRRGRVPKRPVDPAHTSPRGVWVGRGRRGYILRRLDSLVACRRRQHVISDASVGAAEKNVHARLLRRLGSPSMAQAEVRTLGLKTAVTGDEVASRRC